MRYCAKAMRKLTPTSYAILGLLALRPWSAYELTKQVRRSLHFCWPRAEVERWPDTGSGEVSPEVVRAYEEALALQSEAVPADS